VRFGVRWASDSFQAFAECTLNHRLFRVVQDDITQDVLTTVDNDPSRLADIIENTENTSRASTEVKINLFTLSEDAE
jgi:hypothetical protein